MRIVLLSNDKRLAESIRRTLGLVDSRVLEYIPIALGTDPESLLTCFHRVSDAIETYKDSGWPDELRKTIILIDPCGCDVRNTEHSAVMTSINELLPLKRPTPKSLESNQLYGLISLTFPEAHMVFLTEGEVSDFLGAEAVNPLMDSHVWSLRDKKTLDKILAVHNEGFLPLFDPSGFRNSQLTRIPKTSRSGIPNRGQCAAAVDEEEEYAYLHAYVAYRLGYRCHVVTTQSMMSRLFRRPQPKGLTLVAEGVPPSAAVVNLTFEDLYLSFPDATACYKEKSHEELHFSHLQDRDEYFGVLSKVARRFFITAGHGHTQWDAQTREYIRGGGSDSNLRLVYKPHGGIYDLLIKCHLEGEYWKNRTEMWIKVSPSQVATQPEPHSAPGRLLLVAGRLISRARRLFDSAGSVPDCIHGAMLALEAQELLGYKTPTTSLEAITLRHKLEVKAECMFQGMEYNINVASRLREIENEVRVVSRWFNPAARHRSGLNAEMSIVTEIMRIFSAYGQFDEEQECVRRLRRLDREWYFLRHPWVAFLKPVRWYLETLLGSFPLFSLAIIAWPVLFGLLAATSGAVFGTIKTDVAGHIINAFTLFFGHAPMQLPEGIGSCLLDIVVSVFGFAHLGIFISYLYSTISRK